MSTIVGDLVTYDRDIYPTEWCGTRMHGCDLRPADFYVVVRTDETPLGSVAAFLWLCSDCAAQWAGSPTVQIGSRDR